MLHFVRSSEAHDKMKKNSPDRKLLVISALVGLIWVAASLVLKLLPLTITARLLIGIVPIALLFYQIVVIYRYVRSQDEFLRSISLEALAFAFPIGLLGVFIIGLMMRSGIAIQLDFMDAGYLLIAGYAAGYFLAYRRYQ